MHPIGAYFSASDPDATHGSAVHLVVLWRTGFRGASVSANIKEPRLAALLRAAALARAAVLAMGQTAAAETGADVTKGAWDVGSEEDLAGHGSGAIGHNNISGTTQHVKSVAR